MQTLTGFNAIKPGTWFFVPSLFAHDSGEADVIRPIPRTFEEVQDGFVLTTTHLGSPWQFIKLKGTHWIGESTRDRPRLVNAVFHKSNEPMWVEPRTKVRVVMVPKRNHFRRLRKTFFEHVGAQIIRINAVREDADVGENSFSLSGTFEFFTDRL